MLSFRFLPRGLATLGMEQSAKLLEEEKEVMEGKEKEEAEGMEEEEQEDQSSDQPSDLSRSSSSCLKHLSDIEDFCEQGEYKESFQSTHDIVEPTIEGNENLEETEKEFSETELDNVENSSDDEDSFTDNVFAFSLSPLCESQDEEGKLAEVGDHFLLFSP